MNNCKIGILKLQDLDVYGHDVYEFSYAKNYPEEHWHKDSFYVPMDSFILLSPSLDKVFSNYHYYGSQKVYLSDWEKVKNFCLSSNEKEKYILDFFTYTDEWMKSNDSFDYFWILGV